MSTITERAAGETAGTQGRACEAICTFFGIETPCPGVAAGLFRRACAHEHVRDGWLCTGHSGTPQNGLCQTCWELPGEASHECPIGIAEVTA